MSGFRGWAVRGASRVPAWPGGGGGRGLPDCIRRSGRLVRGRTCECNLAALCRRHHQAKQAPGWHLEQPSPGTLTWTLPSARTYTTPPPLPGVTGPPNSGIGQAPCWLTGSRCPVTVEAKVIVTVLDTRNVRPDDRLARMA